MAFSLGSIYVELVANTAKFLTGMDKASLAAKKTGKDVRSGLGEIGGALGAFGGVGQRVGAILQGLGSQAKDMFDVVANKGRGLGTLFAGSILGGISALAGGMVALAMKAADVGAKIFDASEKTGISAGQMSGLMAITKETGGNFDGLTKSLARAGANLEKTRESGGKSNRMLWEMMGGAKGAAELGLKPMGDRIQAVLAHIFGLNDVAQRNLALNQLLGRGWMENVTSLRILAEQGYAPAIEKAKQFGIFFDDNAATQAKQFSAAIAEMKAEATSLGMSIGQWAIPQIKNWMQGLQGIIPHLEAFGHAIAAIGLASIGQFKAAKEEWDKYHEGIKEADQAQTNFLTHLDDVTRTVKGATDAVDASTTSLKNQRSAIKDLTDGDKELTKYYQTLGDILARSKVLAEWGHGAPEAPPSLAVPGLSAFPAAALGMGGGLPAEPSIWADQSRKMADDFHNAFVQMEADADKAENHLSNMFYSMTEAWEHALAHMVVTGKGNFKQIYQGFEENLVHAGIQKGVGGLLGLMGIHAGGGGKPDGSQGNPLYVKMAERIGGVIGGGEGAAVAGGRSIFGSLAAFVGKIGGFLQGGGPVTPGKAYVVGEKHPEFFVPGASGAVVPSLSLQQLRPLHYSPTYHINTPNADSFRRSQDQILTEGMRTASHIHARNS
jgi:hypothetical protein